MTKQVYMTKRHKITVWRDKDGNTLEVQIEPMMWRPYQVGKLIGVKLTNESEVIILSEELELEHYASIVETIICNNIELLDFVETLEHETDSRKLKDALGCIYKRTLSLQSQLFYYA